MPLNKSAAVKEYNDKKVPKEMHDEMLAIAELLTDKDKMNKYLGELETAMQHLYTERTGIDFNKVNGSKSPNLNKTLKILGSQGRSLDDPTRHLLSTVLTKYEYDEHFSLYVSNKTGHPLDVKNPAADLKPISMTGALTSTGFKAHLDAGEQAKDYVTIPHGVYTHRIQWFCIAKAKADIGVRNEIVDLYKKFYEGEAWYITFDRTSAIGFLGDSDFRNPEKLNNYMTYAGDASFPLLSGYLKSKRENLGFSAYSRNVMRVIAAQKMFGIKIPGWKEIKNDGEREKLLKSKLTPSQLKDLDAYFQISGGNDKNVLYPTRAGTYSNTKPQKSAV